MLKLLYMYRPIDPHELRLDKALGYVYFIDKNHPLGNAQGKVYYHRHVMSVQIERWISGDEIVHHENGNRQDNRQINLSIKTKSEHAREHQLARGKPIAIIPCHTCHAQTRNKKYCSFACGGLASRKPKPSLNELKTMLFEHSMEFIGETSGVSGATVKTWCLEYGLITRKRGESNSHFQLRLSA